MSIPVHPWSSSAFSSLTKWFSSQACRPSSCPWLTQFMQNIANSSYNKISLSIPTLSEIYILTFVYWQSIKHILYAVSMLVTSVEITQHFKNLISLPVGHSYPLTLSGYISLNPSPFLFRCFSLLQLSLRINAAKKFSKATNHPVLSTQFLSGLAPLHEGLLGFSFSCLFPEMDVVHRLFPVNKSLLDCTVDHD